MEIKMPDNNIIYDSIIVGLGPAGLNAALYLKRKGFNIALMGRQRGGQVANTSSVENYLGYDFLTGFDMVEKFSSHVNELDIPQLEYFGVTEITKSKGIFNVTCDDEKTYKSKSLIYCAGANSRKLGVEGEDKYFGRGVTYCATCDGPLYKGKKVVVAGGGNSAVESAIDLSKIATHVTLVHRSAFRADKILLDVLEKLPNVDIMLSTTIEEIKGDNLGVTSIAVKNKETSEVKEIETQGVFVEIGLIPNSDLLKGMVELNEKGEVKVNEDCASSLEGLYAAGDVTNVKYKQIVIAAAQGATAALSANEYLTRLR